MHPIDINPFPLGAVAPTSGTPLSVLTNFPDLCAKSCKLASFYAPDSNSGKVYVGASTMVRTTFSGVLLVINPGETRALPFNDSAGNTLSLNEFYLDVDTTGDRAVVSVLFA